LHGGVVRSSLRTSLDCLYANPPTTSVNRSAENASGACCPGGGGMEVGKGQQAQARRNQSSD